MHKFIKNPTKRSFLPPPIQPYPKTAGNVLIYVVVLMLIFGVLGVVMVSLFTTTTASTVTRNDTRRARYMGESGMRYAFSELRNNDFDPDVINTLSTTTYTLNSPGTFTINVFGPWFESLSEQIINNSQLTLNLPEGALPDNYSVPDGLWIVNFEYTGSDTDETYTRSSISNYQRTDDTTLTFDVGGDFNVRDGDAVCLAVQPAYTQNNLSEGDDIVVAAIAQDFFPRSGGAININRVDYSYERLVEEGGEIKLKNISTSGFRNTLPAFPLTVENTTDGGGTYNGEFIVLSPRNHTVVPTGTSEEVSYGGDVRFGLNIYDYSLPWALSRKPDISADELTSNIIDQETDTRFFEVDTLADELYIGGALNSQFGSAFYAGSETIGGQQNYCQQGACLFKSGVRVFFLLDFDQQGDGITFTLTNAATNTASSVGGDFALGETMGYAGDSRLDDAGTTFLASNENDRGLDPPKIAVEFDTWTNNRVDDPPPDYCADASSVNTSTRNDPLAGNEDAVQYVFWGRTSFLNIPCRNNNTLYDDNRHDADGEQATEEWRFATSGLVTSSPVIGSDGTVYVVSDGKLYAINPDGSQKWVFTDNTLGFSPAYDDNDTPADISDDTIYAVGSGDGFLYAITSDGTPKGLSWPFNAQGDFDSSPTVGPDHTIYVGRDYVAAGNPGQVIAVNPDGTTRGLNWPFQIPTGVENDVDAQPVVDDNGTPADTTDDTIYVGSEDGSFYAINWDGTFKWSFATGYVVTAAAIATDGTVYVGSTNSMVYAINPDGTPRGLSWPFDTDGQINSSPAVNPDDGTIYIGSDDGHLYAINPSGTERWRFPESGSIGAVRTSPALDQDSTIYFGSNDTVVYAVYWDGTERWQFATAGPVRSSPAIEETGYVHVGSDDTNVYTINQFADPRNFKDEDKSAGKLLTLEDLGLNVSAGSNTNWLNGAGARGSWAVRLEVDRSQTGRLNGAGELVFDYELRLWMRQCTDPGDTPCDEILGTFYQDTRFKYDYTAVQDLPMRQSFSLSGADHDAFERFFFGFTGAAGVEALDVTISRFQLSFVRPGDPVIICEDDPARWPREAPLGPCAPDI